MELPALPGDDPSAGLRGRRRDDVGARDDDVRFVVLATDDPRIRVVVELLERDPGRPMNVLALAAAVRLSGSRLRHVFKQEIGESLGAYHKRCRLARAARSLEGSFLSVKEILADIGYRSASHFTRDFKQKYQMTPSEWRRRQH